MKKIISLAIAIIVAFSFLAFPFVVSADDESEMTNQEYYASQLYLISKYKDGKISYSEFQEQSQAVTDEFVSKNTVGGVLQSGALNASNTFSALAQKIGGMADKYGNAAYDYLSALASGLLDGYAVQNQTPTVDMNGSGALAVVTGVSSTRKIILHFYGDYGVIRNLSNVPYDRRHRLYSNDNAVCYHIEYAYDLNGKLLWGPINSYDNYGFKEYDGADQGGYSGFEYIESVKYYGDWRNEQDGTPIETDDTYETISDYDFTQATDKELEDLINDLLNEFELQMPDLSSIEGLLNAIYARLGTLDSDNDNGLLSDINSSIQSLNSSISEFSSNIENSINGLKETVSSLFSDEDDDTDNDTVKHEIAGTLYNVIPLEKNWIRKITHDKANLHVEYQGKQYYLEDDGTLKLGEKYYKVDMNYSSTLDEILYTLLDIRDTLDLLTEEEKKMSFNDFFDLKLDDLKTDFDEQFKFKDDIKVIVDNFLDSVDSLVPEYNGGGQS